MNRPSPSAGSYVLEHLDRPEAEVARLEVRAKLRLAGFPELLRRHGLPNGGQVLEIGCGQGLRTRTMAELSEGLRVVGIDRNGAFIEHAQRAAGDDLQNLTYLTADLYNLPFAEGSVDFVYARLVFMHLPDPALALRHLHGLLKPGGRILIEDADRDCMFFEPAPSTFAEYWRNVQEGQRSRGGDPNVGRRLGSHLKAAGFRDVRIEVQPIVGEGEQIDFMVRELLPTLNEYLEPNRRREGELAVQDLGRLAQNPHATFLHFWFVVSGGKALSGN